MGMIVPEPIIATLHDSNNSLHLNAFSPRNSHDAAALIGSGYCFDTRTGSPTQSDRAYLGPRV